MSFSSGAYFGWYIFAGNCHPSGLYSVMFPGTLSGHLVLINTTVDLVVTIILSLVEFKFGGCKVFRISKERSLRIYVPGRVYDRDIVDSILEQGGIKSEVHIETTAVRHICSCTP